VEDKTPTTRKMLYRKDTLAENPPQGTDGHTTSDLRSILFDIKPGHFKLVIGVWKAVDERRW
jgi:hypothetical protein